MYRVLPPKVVSSCLFNAIQDKGGYQAAVSSSTSGNFLFTEHKAGTNPLFITGTPKEIIDTFAKHPDKLIDNRITDLPDVYLDIGYYTPEERFTGLFPVEDITSALVQQVAGFAPGNTITDIAGGMKDFVDIQKGQISAVDSLKEKTGSILGVKISYLPENGLSKIGEEQVSCGDIAKLLSRLLYQ